MLTFLSDDWIEALDAAGAAGRDHLLGSDADHPILTIEQRVNDPAGDDIVYSVRVYADGVRVQKGPTDAADVTFSTDRATAAAVARGQISAQAAFMSGDLHLVGEAAALLRSQTALEDLADRFASVRDQTEW